MVDNLFQLAIVRLRKVAKLRREAIEFYKTYSTEKGASENEEKKDFLDILIKQKRSSEMRELSKRDSKMSFSLRQIDQLNGSNSKSSEDSVSEFSQRGAVESRKTQTVSGYCRSFRPRIAGETLKKEIEEKVAFDLELN